MQCLNQRRKDASAGDWGRPNEQPHLTLPGDNQRLGLGRGGTQFHQNDGGRHGGDGCGSVQGDAQLTVVGVDRIGVQMGDLRERNGRKQHQAQASDNREQS